MRCGDVQPPALPTHREGGINAGSASIVNQGNAQHKGLSVMVTTKKRNTSWPPDTCKTTSIYPGNTEVGLLQLAPNVGLSRHHREGRKQDRRRRHTTNVGRSQCHRGEGMRRRRRIYAGRPRLSRMFREVSACDQRGAISASSGARGVQLHD